MARPRLQGRPNGIVTILRKNITINFDDTDFIPDKNINYFNKWWGSKQLHKMNCENKNNIFLRGGNNYVCHKCGGTLSK